MTRVAIKSLSERRMRTVLTALAIVLGVAMISGAYTLTDTMGNAANSLSKSSYHGTDAVVSVKPPAQGPGRRHRHRQHQRPGQDHRQGRQGRRQRALLRPGRRRQLEGHFQADPVQAP